MNLYTIKDKLKGKEAFTAIALENDEVAVRVCRDTIKSTPAIRNNAEDYTLYRIGRYSPIECKITDWTQEVICNFEEIFDGSF